jgi:cyanophycinase
MSDSMITGNQYRTPPDTNGYYGDEFSVIARRSIEIVPGFGLLPGTIVDQHFIVRERHNRLLSVILERPSMIGVGIDESTALEVEPDGTWRVTGAGSVVIYDARRAHVTAAGSTLLGATDIQTHILPSGSRFDPVRRRAHLPSH